MDNYESSDLLCDGTSLGECTEEPSLPNQKLDAIKETETLKTVRDMAEEERGCETYQKEEVVPNDGKEEGQACSIEKTLEKVAGMCERMSNQILDMETLFHKRIMYANHEEKVIDQMHEELEKYKKDLYFQLIHPILLDIIEVRDSIIRISETYLKKAENEQNIPNKTFAGYAYDLQDILEKNNVEIYKGKRGNSFVPAQQRVVKKEIINDAKLHGKIAESLSYGYKYNGRVIAAEKVSVYFYEKNVEVKNESEDN